MSPRPCVIDGVNVIVNGVFVIRDTLLDQRHILGVPFAVLFASDANGGHVERLKVD